MNDQGFRFTLSRRALLAFGALGLAAGSALAGYPDRPIRIVVPWPPGGATDQVARMLSQPLSQALATPVVVENKAGAGGVIGTQAFVKEKADGYTILLATSSTNAAAPYLYSKPGFDPALDFTPVVSLCEIPNLMVVPTKSPWHSLKDIVAAAKQAPDKYTYGSAGIGGSQHLAGAQFKTAARIDIRHVPYKGSGPAAQDLIAGHIDMMIDTGSLGSIRGNLLRPIAVASNKRLAALPNVPTFTEAGTPMVASAWYGLMLPANAPADVVQRLNVEVNKILKMPEIQQRLTDMGAFVMGGPQQEFAKFAASELKRYEGIVRDSGAPRE
ncbi:tripartite tricarboxylate transporter substrate binding protein [Ramlibacter sp.]|uniref:Bug family tripartite tricarboxylate transporter substrate binding protein n=1 Tax=Ramlibacter sp. TaxID=1917967 RepID=UPI002B804C88|nr:tripartite tricarboxylate transporter substrate binding protein [Ramlibacter sp.]HWI80572.1 tripartite tricarboxylate transporter substrate binding protein [Ramlibacter sp.]